MVNEQIQNLGRSTHDIGLAAWYGGQLFGKFALNPVVSVIDDRPTRGRVVNSGWFTFNPIGVAGLTAGAVVHTIARLTEVSDDRLSETERRLAKAQDALMATCVVLTALTGLQGARLARQAPEGAVPIEDGTTPGPDTPPDAARLQRSIGVLGNSTLAAGTGLLIFNALLDRVAFTHPSPKRGLRRGLLRRWS